MMLSHLPCVLLIDVYPYRIYKDNYQFFCSAYLAVCIVLTANSAHYHKRCQIIEMASRAETPRKFLLTNSLTRATLFVRQEERQLLNCNALSANQSSSAEEQKQEAIHGPNREFRSVYWLFICRTERRRLLMARGRPSVPAPQGLIHGKAELPG